MADPPLVEFLYVHEKPYNFTYVIFPTDNWTLDFRTFRLERIKALQVLHASFPDQPGRRLIDYLRWLETTHNVPLSEFDPDH